MNEQRDCAITAMVTNEDNSFLVTGDSLGNIFIWNILGYASLRRFSEIVLLVCIMILEKSNHLEIPKICFCLKCLLKKSSWKHYGFHSKS